MQTVFSHPPPDSGAYVSRWADGLQRHGAELRAARLRDLLGSFGAVVHIHWPEHMVRPGSPVAIAVRLVRALLLLAVAKAQGNPIVWTVHNLKPHSGWRTVDRVVVGVLHRLLSGVVVTTQAHVALVKAEFPRLVDVPFEVIPLVSLDPGAGPSRRGARRPGPPRLLQFGSIAAYRGPALVLEGLRGLLEKESCELTFVGRSSESQYVADLRAASESLPGVTIRVEHVPDTELRRLILDSDAVVGVQVDGLNTGVLPAALPLDTPVIAADTAQARSTRDRVGAEWVFLLDDLEDPTAWAEAVEWVGQKRTKVEERLFDPVENGRLHLEFYARLTAAR